MHLRAHLRLIRWLGPWAGDSRAPPGVSRRRIVVGRRAEDGEPLEALVYTPTDRAPIGSYLIAHGFNLQGPDDPRCDRFARILSHAGFVVMCPRLHAFAGLRVDASAAADLSRALVALVALDETPRDRRPAIFSISFGSFAALLAAASPEAARLLGGLIVFGGYANFLDTCRFMLGTGPTDQRLPVPDPTCLVGLAINTAGVIFPKDERLVLTNAWRDFVAQVWGIPGMKEPARFFEVAYQLAGGLPPTLVPAFLQGCGVTPGFAPRANAALGSLDTDAMDPRRHLHAIRCPVYLFHGRRDDVIPYPQAHVLAAGLTGTRARTYLTGLYDHSRGQGGPGSGAGIGLGIGRLAALIKEVMTMATMVHVMVACATRSGPQLERALALPARAPGAAGGSV